MNPDREKITLRGGGILDGARVARSDCSQIQSGGAVLYYVPLGSHSVPKVKGKYLAVYAVVGAFGRYLGIFSMATRDLGKWVLTKVEDKPQEEVVQE